MTRVHAALMFVAASAGLAAAASGAAPRDTRRPVADISGARDYISAPQLAAQIIAGNPALRVFDLRSATEFEEMHIPTAQHSSVDALRHDALPPDTTIVLYAEGDREAAQASEVLRLRGYRHVLILRDGLYEWIGRVVEPRLAVDATPSERAAFADAAAQSRFFGGVPRAVVPRAEVPDGYWSGTPRASTGASRLAVAAIRRRGC
jgi:rhodanese-related sulfurtransferase